MTEVQRRIWNLIKVTPIKWILHPWGDKGGGFWVVAIIGNRCLYYNDIEEGYNWSSYTQSGEIDEYFCDQDDLKVAINQITDTLEFRESHPRLGPPQPIEMSK